MAVPAGAGTGGGRILREKMDREGDEKKGKLKMTEKFFRSGFRPGPLLPAIGIIPNPGLMEGERDHGRL